MINCNSVSLLVIVACHTIKNFPVHILQPVGSEEDYQSMYKEEWREVFIIAAEVYLFGAVVYLILGEGKRQWWAGGSNGIERKRMEDEKDFQKDDKDDLVTSESLASSIEFDNEPDLARKSGISIQHPSFV